MPINIKKLLRTHFLYPLAALAIVSVAIVMGDIDRLVADYFYSLQGDSWALKNNWLAETFFHKGGRFLSLLCASLLLVFLIASYCNRLLAVHKKPLWYLFLATAGSSLLISFLKPLLAVSCPWEFERYGGHLLYVDVIEQLLLRNGEGCFPAGQASAGYAWVACYFFGLSYQSKWRWVGLIVPLLAGLVLGIAQQIRGAHFLSHDLWSLATCWFFSLALFVVFFRAPAEDLIAEGLTCQ